MSLAGHSANSLTPRQSGTKGIMQVFFDIWAMGIYEYVLETSKFRHGKWHYKISPDKSCTSETGKWKNEKLNVPELHGHRVVTAVA